MGRFMTIRNTKLVSFHIPQDMFEQCLAGMQQTGIKTFTEFALTALNDLLTRLGMPDPKTQMAGPIPIPRPKPGQIRLSLDDDSPLTAQIPVEEFIKDTEDTSGNLSPNLKELLGLKK